MSTTKQWSPNEDEHLLSMARRTDKLPNMAGRFNTTEEEVIARLKHLKENPPAPAPAQDITPKEEAKAQQLPTQAGDIVAVVFNDVLVTHNNSAHAMENLANVLNSRLNREQVHGALIALRQTWETIRGDKAPYDAWLPEILYQNFVMIPKPRIVNLSTSQPNAQQPNPPAH